MRKQLMNILNGILSFEVQSCLFNKIIAIEWSSSFVTIVHAIPTHNRKTTIFHTGISVGERDRRIAKLTTCRRKMKRMNSTICYYLSAQDVIFYRGYDHESEYAQDHRRFEKNAIVDGFREHAYLSISPNSNKNVIWLENETSIQPNHSNVLAQLGIAFQSNLHAHVLC